MPLGFYSTIFGDRPIEEVAHRAAEEGFNALEIDVVRHVSDPARARTALAAVRGAGLDVCALTFFGNLLDGDHAVRERTCATARGVVDAAAENGVPLVVLFPGHDDTASEDDNYRQLADYIGPLADHAAHGKVKIIFENWPGPRNDYVATTPAGWARLFELVPAPNLGLNFDPSHLVWQGIDPEEALRAVAGRVVLAHAKDTEIVAGRLQQTGYFGRGWWTYRLPGHGRLDWRAWLALLREVGYDGVVSVEHEDAEWGFPGGPVERRWEGLREALRVLRASEA